MSGAVGGSGPARFGVLVASGGSPWEKHAVEAIAEAGPGVVLLRRCLDVEELLAAATTGAARVAVVSHLLPGLDADAVAQLARHGTQVLAVAHERPAELPRLERLGVARVVTDVGPGFGADLRAVAAAADPAPESAPEAIEEVVEQPAAPGRLVAVWGGYGAPGRTTVAVALAAVATRRGVRTLLLDADPCGGTAAQHLGVTEEASGLLAAARSANGGLLDAVRLARMARQVDPGLRLLTGLPRPDRWREVRLPAFEVVLDEARLLDDLVVVDTGAGLPGEVGRESLLEREQLVGCAVAAADALVAVLSADPVGMSRGIRALADLGDVRIGGPVHVVVNRWRPGLGWSPEDVRDTVGRVCPGARVHFLPDDRDAVDRALGAGLSAVARNSQLARSLSSLADSVLSDVAVVPRERTRRLLRRRQTVSSR